MEQPQAEFVLGLVALLLASGVQRSHGCERATTTAKISIQTNGHGRWQIDAASEVTGREQAQNVASGFTRTMQRRERETQQTRRL